MGHVTMATQIIYLSVAMTSHPRMVVLKIVHLRTRGSSPSELITLANSKEGVMIQ